MLCLPQYSSEIRIVNKPSRKPTNLSIDDAVLRDAKALKINLSRAAEDGLKAAVREAKTARWKAENSSAIESSNEFVERNGLPLEKFRPF